MALTVTEATAVNTLLNWLLGRRLEGNAPNGTEATEAACLLADHANKCLRAGIRPDDVPSLAGLRISVGAEREQPRRPRAH